MNKVEQVVSAAGGTVTHGSGAQVVVPQGALAGPVTIGIEEVAANSAPTLPAGVNAVGATFAVTPHGQTFLQDVTVTIPFDPAQVPAGVPLSLLKTMNRADGPWEEVAGATAVGSTLNAQSSGFSHYVVTVRQVVINPSSLAVVSGERATFHVTVLNIDSPFTIRWQRSTNGGASFIDLAATGRSYTTGPTTLNDDGDQYRVVVTNDSGSITFATSLAATLSVSPNSVAPDITQHPGSQTVTVGASASFSCEASGTAVQYQWQISSDGGVTFVDIQGAAFANYVFTVQASNNGERYRCRASNSAGTATSNTATLTVVIPSGTEILSLSIVGDGFGVVTYNPPVEGCSKAIGPTTCERVFNGNTIVILTPTAYSGSTFGGWTGCDSVSGNDCSVTMTGSRAVSAVIN
ncbi:MAG: immunoglobulin domain-containing protein [Nitrospirota bacterium]